jgi:hypothetical protein
VVVLVLVVLVVGLVMPVDSLPVTLSNIAAVEGLMGYSSCLLLKECQEGTEEALLWLQLEPLALSSRSTAFSQATCHIMSTTPCFG